MSTPTPPDGTPIRRAYGPPSPPRMWTLETLGDDVERVRSILHWVILLLIVNLIATIYVASFVHRIITDINQL